MYIATVKNMFQVLPLYIVIRWGYGQNVTVEIRCNGKHFHISLARQDIETTADNGQLIRKYQDCTEILEKSETFREEEHKWLLEPCTTVLHEIAPPVPHLTAYTFEECFHPHDYHIRLRGPNSRLGALSITIIDEPSLDYTRKAFVDAVAKAVLKDVPCVPPSQVSGDPDSYDSQLDFECPLDMVRIDETDGVLEFKPFTDMKELSTLLRLDEVGLPEQVRVPTLQALMMAESEENPVLGILLAPMLHSISFEQARENASLANRCKWARQIKHNVKCLRNALPLVISAGIDIDAQGDAHNSGNNAWWYGDWVDSPLAHTKKGNLPVVADLIRYLNVGDIHN